MLIGLDRVPPGRYSPPMNARPRARRPYHLKIHPHTLKALEAISDEDVTRLVIGPNPEIKLTRAMKSRHTAERWLRVPEELFDAFHSARDEIPIGFAAGDVLDAICNAPADAEPRKYTTVTLFLGAHVADMWDDATAKKIPSSAIVRKALRIARPVEDPQSYNQIMTSKNVNVPRDLLYEWKARGMTKSEQSLWLRTALLEIQPSDYVRRSDFGAGRATLPKRTARLLRGLSWALQTTKEGVVMVGLERIDGHHIQPARQRYAQVRFRFDLATERRIESIGNPPDVITAAIESLVMGNEDEIMRYANTNPQCFRG